MTSYTQGQRHALLVLAREGARIGSWTSGGATWQDRTVHSEVAYLLMERGLVTLEGERLTLTEAGEAASRETHPEYWRRLDATKGDR